MIHNNESREVIPPGTQRFEDHMVPLVRLLIERGHYPIDTEDSELGFIPGPGGMRCDLAYYITEDDWAAINEHFVVPQNIGYHQGLIRDSVNRIDVVGYDAFLDEDGSTVSVDDWVERERQDMRP